VGRRVVVGVQTSSRFVVAGFGALNLGSSLGGDFWDGPGFCRREMCAYSTKANSDITTTIVVIFIL